MKLHRYWFQFPLTIKDPHPPGSLLGVGVTAFDRDDGFPIGYDWPRF